MTTTTAEATEPAPASLGRRLAPADTAFRYVTLGCGLLVLVILGLITFSMAREAWPVIAHRWHNFFLTKTWNPNAKSPLFGSLGFVYGTIVSPFRALGVAGPVTLGIPLLVTEIAPRWLRRATTFFIDLLAAVPSVVFGLW